MLGPLVYFFPQKKKNVKSITQPWNKVRHSFETNAVRLPHCVEKVPKNSWKLEFKNKMHLKCLLQQQRDMLNLVQEAQERPFAVPYEFCSFSRVKT